MIIFITTTTTNAKSPLVSISFKHVLFFQWNILKMLLHTAIIIIIVTNI